MNPDPYLAYGSGIKLQTTDPLWIRVHNTGFDKMYKDSTVNRPHIEYFFLMIKEKNKLKKIS